MSQEHGLPKKPPLPQLIHVLQAEVVGLRFKTAVKLGVLLAPAVCARLVHACAQNFETVACDLEEDIAPHGFIS